VLDDALGAIECRTTAVHDGGDHAIVVGEVIGVSEPQPGRRPLIHHSGRYRTLKGD
jgi:flavin reductase (DIM6/NTAB) family NADH-FMN oxidoreductase RutF